MSEKKLMASEADKRIDISLDKSIRKSNDFEGLMSFGANNDYPILLERLTNGSVTGKAVTQMLSKFFAGLGFENEAINKIKVGTDSRGKKITLQSLLRQAAFSSAMFNGFYIHCNYSIDEKANPIIESTFLRDFKNCRFSKKDDIGYSAKILVYDNWHRENGTRFDKRKVKSFNVFNTNKNVLAEQIKNKNFKGQVYFEFLDNQYFYPIAPLDSAYLDLDNEAQISLYENRELRNGFYGSVIIRLAAGGSEKERAKFIKSVKDQLSVDGDRVTVLEAQVDEETGEIQEQGTYKIDVIPSSVKPALFKDIKEHISDNIRKGIGNVPKVFIDYDAGGLSGASGETLKLAVDFMNALTADNRAQISDSFEEIFKNFNDETLKNNTNWKIKPLDLASFNENIEENVNNDSGAASN